MLRKESLDTAKEKLKLGLLNKISPKVIIVFGAMGTGKSTIAQELTAHLGLPQDAFLEGDNTLLHPDLRKLLTKVQNNDALTVDDISIIVAKLIELIQQKLAEKVDGVEKHSTIVVSQALYFNVHRKMILDAFGGSENVSFVWVHTPNPTHISNLYSREYDKTIAQVKNPTFMDKLKAFGNGVKALATNALYSTYFEEPAGEYKFATSVRNLVKLQRGTEPVNAISFPNISVGETKEMLKTLPFVARKPHKKLDDKKAGSTAVTADELKINLINMKVVPPSTPAATTAPLPAPTTTTAPVIQAPTLGH